MRDGSSSPLHERTLWQLALDLRARKLSSVELTEAYLARIAALDLKVHAYIEVYADQARRMARASDMRLAAGMPAGLLEGIPLAVKDLADIEGYRTTAGSTIYANRPLSKRTATVVSRLLSEGAVLLGKTHLVELAFGGWGTNRAMGTPRNPWDMMVHRSPGGSSSGSGVVVASGMAAGAIGTDTGGSVRIPSAFCGLTGLKVTQGRISNHGFDLVSHTLDTVGPMASSVYDVALLLQAIHGPDVNDPVTLKAHPEDFLSGIEESVRGLRFAVVSPDKLGSIEPCVLEGLEHAIEILTSQGCLRNDAAFFNVDFEADQEECGVIIATESFAGHGKELLASATEGDDASRKRVLGGQAYSGSRYAESLSKREKRRHEFLSVFDATDILVLPTVPVTAKPIATLDESDLSPSRLTRFVGYYGLCAIALPCGLSEEGLPISVQFVAAPFKEKILLRLAAAFQRETKFHLLRPELN